MDNMDFLPPSAPNRIFEHKTYIGLLCSEVNIIISCSLSSKSKDLQKHSPLSDVSLFSHFWSNFP